VFSLIQAIRQDCITVELSEHDMNIMMDIRHWICVLDQGKRIP
jgi:ABC-type branched-subunit amino acid transport system ATPase component